MIAILMSDELTTTSSWLARRAWTLAFLLLLLLRPSPAMADDASGTAARHFASGLTRAKQGDLEGAAGEFETAHRLSPNAAVLYNLGQTYASLGRPVDAVRTLKRYLIEAEHLSSARRQEVVELIAFHEKRIGRLTIALRPADAELLLDGIPVSSGLFDSPYEIAAGAHSLLVRKDGYTPAAVSELVGPGATSKVSIVLEPEHAVRQVWLDVSCSVPDAAAYVDGAFVGLTPLRQSLPVSAGHHDVTFSRLGYDSVPRHVEAGDSTAIACQLSRRARLPTGVGAGLRVSGVPARSRILVDGEPHRGELLPPGRHTVTVEGSGYEGWSSTVTLRRGRTLVLAVELEPTFAKRSRLRDEDGSKRRTYAYIGAGVGTALCGAAGVLYAINSERYEDYSADSRRLSRQASSAQLTPNDRQRITELPGEAAEIQRMDYVALATAMAGAALFGGSVALYVSAGATEGRTLTGALLNLRASQW